MDGLPAVCPPPMPIAATDNCTAVAHLLAAHCPVSEFPELSAPAVLGGACSVLATKQGHAVQEAALAWVPILFSSGPVNGWSPATRSAPVAGHGAGPAAHVEALGHQIRAAQSLAHAHQVPIHFYNAHSGHDSFTEVPVPWQCPCAASDCGALS
jgi:hypothetical protein